MSMDFSASKFVGFKHFSLEKFYFHWNEFSIRYKAASKISARVHHRWRHTTSMLWKPLIFFSFAWSCLSNKSSANSHYLNLQNLEKNSEIQLYTNYFLNSHYGFIRVFTILPCRYLLPSPLNHFTWKTKNNLNLFPVF